ncbi:MAG: stage II sporulation protein M, partial [Leptospirales bacterium]|nr:stage II sporulation protein M [Leptospirales bacterium]
MTPAIFIEQRSKDWDDLEKMLPDLERKFRLPVREILKFARLYRAVSTDLSVAQAFRLSRMQQARLEGLVSRGHSVLYSIPRRKLTDVRRYIFETVPAAIRKDVYVRICLLVFYVPFFLCAGMAYVSRPFAAQVVGEAVLEEYHDMHEGERGDIKLGDLVGASGFYIANNIGLNLITFGLGALVGIGSLFFTLYNAVFLGTIIGYLMSTPARDHIVSWAAAHAPFELTAIGLSAAAGVRIGFCLIAPGARSRLLAIREESLTAMPALYSAAMLTFFAAFIEAFLGPWNP